MTDARLARLGATPAETAERLHEALQAFEQALLLTRDRWHTPVAEHLAARGASSPYRCLWSPAQQAEHVLKVNVGTSKVIYLLGSGRALPGGPVPPGQLDGERRLAPPHLQPGAGLDWSELEPDWRATCERLLSEAARVHPANARTYPHPFLGELGPLDWARMAVWHTHNHRRQLGLES